MLKVLLFLGTCAALSKQAFGLKNYYMDTQCSTTVSASFYQQFRVQLSTSPSSPGQRCTFTIYTEATDMFMVYFRDLSIQSSSSFCNDNWLEVHDGSTRSASALTFSTKLCGYSTPVGVFTTTGNHMTFFFESDSSSSNAAFDIIVTPYHTGFCSLSEYECSNGRCIDESLTCSGYNPCGDYSDCYGGVTISTGGNAGAIAVGVVGGIFFIIGITVAIIVSRRRRRTVVVRTTDVTTSLPPPPGDNNPNYGSVQSAGAVYP